MTINEEVEKIIIENLYRYPSGKQLEKIREVAGHIVTRTTDRVVNTLSVVRSMPTEKLRTRKRVGQPHLLAAVDMCCQAVDVPPQAIHNVRMGRYAHPVVYMLRSGIAFPVQPSWNEIADVMLYLGHTSSIQAWQAASKHGDIVAQMFDYMETNMVKTNPRPDWARKEQVA